MKSKSPYYQRNLPHWQPKGGVFAVTTCLNGSLPREKVKQLRAKRDLLIKTAKQSGKTEKEIKEAIRKSRELYFGKYDALIDNNSKGPQWLAHQEIVAIAQESLAFLDGRDFILVAYCIMSNHIHLVCYKCNKQLNEIMASFKRYVATRANRILYGICPKGKLHPPFWQAESYDHLIRDDRDFYGQVSYALNNPVKAGLVHDWRDWRYSYLKEEFEYIMAS